MSAAKWPKILPPLTDAQRAISDDFMHHWHEVLPRRFGIIEKFNHNYPVKHASAQFVRTLEIGAGRGEHLLYERLNSEQRANYYSLELRAKMCCSIRERFPDIQVIEGDCQKRLDFPDGYFDRILAVHVLEHLPDLPAALRETRRLCAPHGTLSVVIPCEGGAAYTLARRISAQRIFERRYKQSYRWFIEREHLNRPYEIFEELRKLFRIERSRYFPIPIPVEFCNLVIGLKCMPL